jgi:hypothetical protein
MVGSVVSSGWTMVWVVLVPGCGGGGMVVTYSGTMVVVVVGYHTTKLRARKSFFGDGICI